MKIRSNHWSTWRYENTPGVSLCSSDSPYAVIVRRYLSLLDAAVELEYREYSGPRLQDAHKVLMFDHALTADEVNRKYR